MISGISPYIPEPNHHAPNPMATTMPMASTV